jgi:hypothetical protein
MPLAVMLVSLAALVVACSPPPAPPATSLPQATPTTIVVIVTVPPPGPTSVPTPVPALPSPPAGADRVITLMSDGVSVPPAFRLAGGDYVFAWTVPRPRSERGCTFDAMLISEPSVSPFTLQTLGPWAVSPAAGLTGSKRIAGLGAGGYALRPNGDCPWTVTITPVQAR